MADQYRLTCRFLLNWSNQLACDNVVMTVLRKPRKPSPIAMFSALAHATNASSDIGTETSNGIFENGWHKLNIKLLCSWDVESVLVANSVIQIA